MNPTDQALEALKEISALDYSRAAVNGCAHKAVMLARKTVESLEAQKAEGVGKTPWGHLKALRSGDLWAKLEDAALHLDAVQWPDLARAVREGAALLTSQPATDSSTAGEGVERINAIERSMMLATDPFTLLDGVHELAKIGRVDLAGAPVQGAVSTAVRDAMDKLSNGISNDDLNWVASGFSDLEEALQLPASVSDEGVVIPERIEKEYAYLWAHADTGETVDELATWFSTEEIDMILMYRLLKNLPPPRIVAYADSGGSIRWNGDSADYTGPLWTGSAPVQGAVSDVCANCRKSFAAHESSTHACPNDGRSTSIWATTHWAPMSVVSQLPAPSVTNVSRELMEALAADEHDRWAGQALTALNDMTDERRERWARLAKIPYADLDEKNKELDRMQVRERLAIMAKFQLPAPVSDEGASPPRLAQAEDGMVEAVEAIINSTRTMVAGKMSKGEFVNEEWVNKAELLASLKGGR